MHQAGRAALCRFDPGLLTAPGDRTEIHVNLHAEGTALLADYLPQGWRKSGSLPLNTTDSEVRVILPLGGIKQSQRCEDSPAPLS